MSRPRVLFLAHLLPWPLDGGGQIKSYYTVKTLADVYDVTLFAFVRRAEEEQNLAPLLPLCAGGVQTVLLCRGKPHDAFSALRAFGENKSFLVTRDDSGAMRDAVKNELAARDYAFVHIDHLQVAQFVPKDTGKTKVVLDEHNAEYRILQRLAEKAKARTFVRTLAQIEAGRLKKFEAQAIARADRTLVVSSEDAHSLACIAPTAAGRIYAVPIGVDLHYFQPQENRTPATPPTLLLLGTMFWPPNVDAAQWFVHEIFPLVQKASHGVRLEIVGGRPSSPVLALARANPAVTVTGWVKDVRPHAHQCAVFVVPLRAGSGMRVKILSALAMGLPVVSTTVGAEGIEVTHNENILLADTPADFAHAVLRVLNEPGLGQRLGQAGRALMETHYGWEGIGARLLAVYEEMEQA